MPDEKKDNIDNQEQKEKTVAPKAVAACVVALLVLAVVCVAVFLTFNDFFFGDDSGDEDITETQVAITTSEPPSSEPAATSDPGLGEALEGGWYNVSGDIILFFLNTVEIVFDVTGDNTGIIYTDNSEADWYIDSDGILRIKDSLDFRFEISGDTLTLTDIEGDSRIYKRATESGRPVYTSRIGSETHGFVTVPDLWVPFIDDDATPGMIQYTDGDGSIITLDYFEPDMKIDVYGTLQNIAAELEAGGAREVDGATALLNGETVYQLYARYTSDNIYVVIWMFENPDGSVNYICAEGPQEAISDVYAIVRNTFSFEEFE